MADADIEILTEHFGYPPVSLLDDIINAINILAESALMSIEQGLLRSPPSALGFRAPRKSKKNPPPADAPSIDDLAKFEIDNGTHQLETLLCSSIDRNFDIFELYVMRNILCLRPADRPWLRLRHYDILDFAALSSPDAPTPASVTALRKKVKASQRLSANLEAEKAQNAVLLSTLRSLISRTSIKPDPDATPDAPSVSLSAPLAFLGNTDSLGAADAAAPLQTTTGFALSQLPALRALSASLRALAEDLQPTEEEGGVVPETPGRRTWRKGRVEYVEGATRKHLERVRGLELGEQGEVRDGEWQGEGRKIGMGEVEGLEGILGMVGGVLPVGNGGGRGSGSGSASLAAGVAPGTVTEPVEERQEAMDES